MKKRIIISVLCLLLIVAGLFVYRNIAENNDMKFSTGPEFLNSNLRFFAMTMGFDEQYPPAFRELPFGHLPPFTVVVALREEEADSLMEENTLVLVPSEDTVGIFERFNEALVRTESDLQERSETHNRYARLTPINLADFGFSYPLTIEDFADNWSAMRQVYLLLDMDEMAEILRIGRWRN